MQLFDESKQSFRHSMDIYDYFENTELARQYAFTKHLVDLNHYSDEELAQHGMISGYEIALKAIARS